MKNFISINGKTTELTDEQLRELGLLPDTLDKQIIDELSEIVRSGKAREFFKIHRVVQIGGYELEPIGFDCETIDDDFPFADWETEHTITLMAKTLLPARRMHDGACERGWIDTELREYLNEEFINELPSELVAHIRTVEKITHNSKGEVFKTKDRLFLPSESELFGSAIYSDYEDGERYEAFANRDARKRFNEDGDSCWYWTRSANGGNSTAFATVHSGGGTSTASASHATGRVPLCLCFS